MVQCGGIGVCVCVVGELEGADPRHSKCQREHGVQILSRVQFEAPRRSDLSVREKLSF